MKRNFVCNNNSTRLKQNAVFYDLRSLILKRIFHILWYEVGIYFIVYNCVLLLLGKIISIHWNINMCSLSLPVTTYIDT